MCKKIDLTIMYVFLEELVHLVCALFDRASPKVVKFMSGMNF